MPVNVKVIGMLAVALSLSPVTASSTVLIRGDNGGLMEDYAKRFAELERSGEHVVIDGSCMSACTMVLGLVPRERICATERAVLGFHAAWQYTTAGLRVGSAAGTRDLMRLYPAPVRAWIVRHGGLKPQMMFMRGPALASILPTCRESGDKVASRIPRHLTANRSRAMRGRQASANSP